MQRSKDDLELEFELHQHLQEIEGVLAFARRRTADEALTFLNLWRKQDWLAIRCQHPDFPLQHLEDDQF